MSAILALRTSTSSLSSALSYMYHDMWQDIGDPRVVNFLFFESGPWNVISIVLIYLYFILAVGPRFMKHRKPFDLRQFALTYNIAMVIINGYIFYQGMIITKYGTDAWGCNLVDYRSKDENEARKLHIGHYFFLTKIIELLDTIIFTLRKKTNQISVLHVVHHSLVPLLIWTGYKVSPGGNMALFPLVNSFIHTIMYAYYGLTIVANTTSSPAVRDIVLKCIWWKKYLTRLQMAQFVLVMIHSVHVLFFPSCNFPKGLLYMSFANALLFLILFGSFYRSAYKSSSTSSMKSSSDDKQSTKCCVTCKDTHTEANNNKPNHICARNKSHKDE